MLRALLVPLRDDVVGPASRTLEPMLGAVGLVLVLVCVNIANLLLVRGSERAREFALRAALGARGGRLRRQSLTESAMLAVAGGVVGVILARGLVPAIVALGRNSIPRLAALSIDWRVLASAFLVARACAIVFGLAAALRAARIAPGDVMRETAQTASGGVRFGRLRSALVSSQVALGSCWSSGRAPARQRRPASEDGSGSRDGRCPDLRPQPPSSPIRLDRPCPVL